MKIIDTVEAVGQVLCHDLTQIIPNVSKGARFRKGYRVQQEDIPILLAMGKEHLHIEGKEEGQLLREVEAAKALYDLCSSPHLAPSEVKEGKIEARAQTDGLLWVDTQRLAQVNAFGQVMIATKRHLEPVTKGQTVAGMRIIPLFIEKEKIEALTQQTGPQPLLKILPYSFKRVGIITTGSEVYHGRIEDGFKTVLEKKLADFPTQIIAHRIVDDQVAMIRQAILDMTAQGAQLILCMGGMSVDADDLTPQAIQQSGAQIVSYGTPVLPGAMFLLAYGPPGTVIMGRPGSVMFAKKTVFDVLLPRVMADQRISSAHIAALGHGGLL